MLRIKDISKSFGGVQALKRCSFDIPAHQITALIGPNGAGKTTLFDVISGLLKPDRGTIELASEIESRDITHMRPDRVANLGVSRTFQQVRLFKNLTILDHLLLAEHHDDVQLWKSLFSKDFAPHDHSTRKKSAEYIKRFAVTKGLDTLVSDLSYGQRKLLQMAMAFLKPHDILLLDEPIAGVNAVIQKDIERLLLDFKQHGETVVIIEHDIEFVQKLADHVVVLDEGSVLLAGEPKKVLADRKVLEAYLGE